MNKKYPISIPCIKNAAERKFSGLDDTLPEKKKRLYKQPKYRVDARYDNLWKGFTLIELLVVVLIVGVLAAVALPQYEAAVMKSRFMSFMPTVRSLKDAQERYYMANGKYAVNLSQLDVQIPGDCAALWTNEILCGTDWLLDDVRSLNDALGMLAVTYCPGKNGSGSTSCNGKTAEATMLFYYAQQPEMGGQFKCAGSTEKGKKLCKTFNGVFN